MLVSSRLILASASVIFILGLVHLIYTFRGPKLAPRDASLTARLKTESLVISRQASMWNAWLGLNASHSLGAMLFGLVYGYLAVHHHDLLFESLFLGLLGGLMLLCYALLAWFFWFSTPFRGILLALVLYVSGMSVALANTI